MSLPTPTAARWRMSVAGDAFIGLLKVNKIAVQGAVAGGRHFGQVLENKDVVCGAANSAETGLAAGPQAVGLGKLIKTGMQHHVVKFGNGRLHPDRAIVVYRAIVV